eukprot:10690272-Heterocapsa_arctica.AAC.1
MKGQKRVVQGNQLNKDEHLHRMRNKEEESDFNYSERGCGEMKLQVDRTQHRCPKSSKFFLLGLIGDRMKCAVKKAKNARRETFTRDSLHKTNAKMVLDDKQKNMKLGDA